MGRSKYCSLACYWKKSPKFKYNCRQCGKVFWTYPSFRKKGEGFLCSKQCKFEWISEKYRGRKSKSGWKNAKIKMNCKWCGRFFFEFRSRVADNRGVFCSKKCYSFWFARYSKGEIAPAYIDGQGNFPYPPDFSKRLKEVIKKRDRYRCQYCGKLKNLSVHHKNFNKNDNRKRNLITACISCNSSMKPPKDVKITR